MRKPMSRIVPVAAALLLGAAAARAQPPQGGGGQAAQGPGFGERREHGPHGALTRMLGLSDEQQQKLRAILDERRPQLEALHEKLGANREALEKMLESGSADASAVGELVLEGRKLHEQGRLLRESEQKAIRGILTPEQQKTFDAMKERRRERGPHGPGHYGMPGGFGPPGMQKPQQPGAGEPPVQP